MTWLVLSVGRDPKIITQQLHKYCTVVTGITFGGWVQNLHCKKYWWISMWRFGNSVHM